MALRAPRGAPAFNASRGLLSRPSLLGARALSSGASSGARGTTVTAFRKYHGIGNDFVLVDNRAPQNPLNTLNQSVAICNQASQIRLRPRWQ